MNSAAEATPVRSSALPLEVVPMSVSTRFADYLSLARPRIAIMVLITVSVGFLVGHEGQWLASGVSALALLHAWLGVTLATAGSSALNQWLERKTDARMARTMDRALPSGRLSPLEVATLGFCLCIAGCLYLAFTVNLLTAWLTALTSIIYAFLYTPLKRWTSLCTAIGAIPGAMPPVLGWTAAGQSLDLGAFSLFGLMFFWQFPHFLAIAWLYREDYLAAGLRMLPGGRPLPHVTGLMATGYALGLLPISLIPGWMGMAGNTYSVLAIVLGLIYLVVSIQFAVEENRKTARQVLWVSLIYLPVILAALAGDHIRLIQ